MIDRCNCRNIQAVRAFAVIGILTAGLAFTGAAAVYWLRTVEPPMVKMRLGFMGMAGERRCQGLGTPACALFGRHAVRVVLPHSYDVMAPFPSPMCSLLFPQCFLDSSAPVYGPVSTPWPLAWTLGLGTPSTWSPGPVACCGSLPTWACAKRASTCNPPPTLLSSPGPLVGRLRAVACPCGRCLPCLRELHWAHARLLELRCHLAVCCHPHPMTLHDPP
jgi:hypothetical protein